MSSSIVRPKHLHGILCSVKRDITAEIRKSVYYPYGISQATATLSNSGGIIANIDGERIIVSGHNRLLVLANLKNKSKSTITLKQFTKRIR